MTAAAGGIQQNKFQASSNQALELMATMGLSNDQDGPNFIVCSHTKLLVLRVRAAGFGHVTGFKERLGQCMTNNKALSLFAKIRRLIWFAHMETRWRS